MILVSYITLLTTGRKLHHNSSFFREPYVFKFLPEYIKERFSKDLFPEGININLGACAQGEDVWSLIITLENDDELQVEDNSITASDINPSVVNMARAGILSFLPRTLKKARTVVPDITEYFDSMPNNGSAESDRQKLLKEYQALLEQGGFRRKTNSGDKVKYVSVRAEEARLSMLYRVSKELKRKVKFRVVDFQKEFQTNRFAEPCLVIFKNALQHFNAREREQFATRLFNALQPGSSLVIGGGDISKGVPLKLIDAGFEPLNPKYNRQSFQNPVPIVRSKDPRAHIFEKK